MTGTSAALVRWLVDPARAEELLGDLEELERAGGRRLWRDVASVCVRQSRLAAAARRPTWVAGVLAAGAVLLLSSNAAPLRRVRAVDPAGEFTLEFAGARVVGATLDGARVPPQRLVHEAGRLVIRGAGDAGGDLTIRLAPDGAFYWRARSPRPSVTP